MFPPFLLPEDSRRTVAGAESINRIKASDVSFQFNICRGKDCVLLPDPEEIETGAPVSSGNNGHYGIKKREGVGIS